MQNFKGVCVTSNQNQARRTAVEISFDGVDITRSIAPYLISLTYTDNEADETDDLQLRLQDRDSIWLEQWLNEAIDAAASRGNDGHGGANAAVEAGGAVTLDNAPFYYTSTAASPSVYKSGTFYFYDGLLIDGRYRITNSAERCGKLPVGQNVTGWVPAGDCVAGTRGSAPSPAPGLTICPIIFQKNWSGDGKDNILGCGQFELDSVEASGPPAVVTVNATSLPFSASLRQTEKSHAWENRTLSSIAGEIAAQGGMALMYASDNDPFYVRVEQIGTSDVEFLSILSRDAGISFKATNRLLVMFDQADYESKTAVFTIKRGGGSYTKYKLRSSTADTQYSSCRVSYTDPGTGQCIEATAKVEDYQADAKNNQQLEIHAKLSSAAEAKTLAEKLLRLHNKYAETAVFTLPGNPGLVAGVTVMLEGWGAFDGRHIVSQAIHTVSRSGYTVQIKLRRALEGY